MICAGKITSILPKIRSSMDDNDEPIVKSLNVNAAGALDVTRIKAKEGQSRCPRCGGAVFMAEAIPVRGKVGSVVH